jgi:hypothetical protein
MLLGASAYNALNGTYYTIVYDPDVDQRSLYAIKVEAKVFISYIFIYFKFYTDPRIPIEQYTNNIIFGIRYRGTKSYWNKKGGKFSGPCDHQCLGNDPKISI